MQAFLEKIAIHLVEKYQSGIGDVCIVLPNRRAGVFLKNYIAKEIKKPVWAPEIFSIEDFVKNLADCQVLDSVDLLFEFYEVYCQHTNNDVQPFEEFCKWAPTLLNDFNEIDNYLVDGEKLFTNLTNIKGIENWSFANEELTDFQKNYLQWWDLLGVYYQTFSSRLRSKKLAYQGMAYYIAAKNIQEQELQQWTKIIFAGFNALNAAEEKIIRSLLQKNKAEIVWDADSYYLNNPLQEAGKFIRKYKKTLVAEAKKDFLWADDLLSTSSKNIIVIGAAKSVTQTKTAGGILKNFEKEKQNKTAVVLADEELLMPMLHSLPSNIEGVNITMGIPLSKTPVADFFDLVFTLQENSKTTGVFYHKNILQLARHPYAYYLFGYELLQELNRVILSKNKSYVSSIEIENVLKEQQLTNVLFKKWTSSTQAIDNVLYLIQTLTEKAPAQQQDNKNKLSLESEYIAAYSKIIFRVQSLQEKYNCIDTLKSLRQVMNQLVRSASLPFYGEPLQGLQLMGMLETRTLDFENVILLSANENILPESKSKTSFIPFDLKKAFGLPTHSDRDAIYAYHFYRLIQRASNIHILYNTETDRMGKGEKSRFVTQLVYELTKANPNITLKEKIIDAKINTGINDNTIVIEKTDNIFEKIDQKAKQGFSPSLLNTYKNCSLQFYFQYVAGLKEAEEVEETIGADVLGNAIHHALEQLYKPYISKAIASKDIEQMQKNAISELSKAFEESYSKSDLTYGKNLLTVKIAEKFLQQFLIQELSFTKNQEVLLESLEKELETTINLLDRQVTLKGKADRIDVIKNIVRIIDYKTGSVNDNELKVNDWNELLTDTKLNKSFQLLLYAYLYYKQHEGQQTSLQSGIISFRKLGLGIKPIHVNNNNLLDEVVLSRFEEKLKELITEIYNPTIPFVQTTDWERCTYCSFKMICNR